MIVGSFSVTSTHTFETPYTGPVTVEISRAGSELGMWTVGQVAVSAEPSTSETRPPTPNLKRAILAATPGGHHETRYLLAFALSAGLQPGATETRQTRATAFGHSSSIAALTSQASSDCYITTLAPPRRSHLKAGAHYRFALTLEGSSPITSDAALRRYPSRTALLSAARRILGCG